MRMHRAIGYPASRTAARWVFDVLVTLLAAASAVPTVLHDQAHPRWGTIVVLALAAVPLLVRRIWPIPVLVCVLAADASAALWNDSPTANSVALLIALYTVAAARTRRCRPVWCFQKLVRPAGSLARAYSRNPTDQSTTLPVDCKIVWCESLRLVGADGWSTPLDVDGYGSEPGGTVEVTTR